MNKKFQLIKHAIILTLILTGLLAGPSTAVAQEETATTSAIFGSIGVAYGQSLQLNVSNTETDDPRVPPDPIGPVQVELQIMDRGGSVVVREVFRLNAGETGSVQVNGDAFSRTTSRVDLRGLVLIRHPRREFDARLIVPTMEIVDSDTRRSSVILNPASLVGFNPQPEPPKGTSPPDDGSNR